MKPLWTCVFLATIAAWAGARTDAAETFESLAARIPGGANAIVLIDVEQTMAAPLAREQGWARKLETAYVERPVYLPPEAKKLALGALLQPDDEFLPSWELAVMELSEPVSVRAIARSEAGYVDELNGHTTAITPSDAGFVDLGNNVLGVVHPASRQFMSRWITFAGESSRPALSPYLQSALAMVNDRAQVLLAVDLTDVLSSRDVEKRLANAAWLKDKKADTAAIVAALATLRGASLRMAVGEKCQGQLQIDFGADVAPLKAQAKPMVLEALGNLGFNTSELATWKVSVESQSIKLQGEMSTDAQRRVFSVIELPRAELSGAETSGGEAAPSESEVRERSLAYFRSTEVLVNDLRKSFSESKSTSAWTDRFARRIDDLPVLHVDEELLDYGDKLAETLRIMSLSKRQAGLRYGTRASSGGGYYDGYGSGGDAYSQAADRSQAKKEEMAVATDVRVQGWKLIDDATGDMRRKMTKKYGVEF